MKQSICLSNCIPIAFRLRDGHYLNFRCSHKTSNITRATAKGILTDVYAMGVDKQDHVFLTQLKALTEEKHGLIEILHRNTPIDGQVVRSLGCLRGGEQNKPDPGLAAWHDGQIFLRVGG